uniref:Helicase ATP-binding domain-containing protein n=1 Tax=viral metagenome TaxID=1070528 RepID=A0A6C0LZ31_9ZZZZ
MDVNSTTASGGGITVGDFIAEYPNPRSNTFQKDMFEKKEFNELQLDRDEEQPVLPTLPYKHQEIVRRFMSPDVLIKEILLVHEVGTGKTLSSQLVVENFNKHGNRALVLVRGDILVRNFKDELATRIKKYVPPNASLLSKDTYTRRRDKLINESYEIDTFRVFLKGVYNRADYVRENYSNRVIIVDEVHNLRIQEGKKAKETKTLYNMIHWFLHTVVNCRIVLLTGTPMWDRTNEIASLMNLMLPMDKQLPTGKEFDDHFFNDGILVNEEELLDAFRGRVSYVRQMITIADRIREGRKNPWEDDKYYEWAAQAQEPVDEDDSPWLKYFKIVPSIMSDFQYEALAESYTKQKEGLSKVAAARVAKKSGEGAVYDTSKGAVGSFHRLSRNASLFVFPDGSYYSGKLTAGFKKYVNDHNGKYSLVKYRDRLKDIKSLEALKVKNPERAEELDDRIADLKLTLPTAIMGARGENTQEQRIEALRQYSAIYADVIKDILDHPNEIAFVYTGDLVSDSGAILFSLVLEMFGFEHTKRPIAKDTPEAQRFTVITSKHFTANSPLPNQIIKSINDPANGNTYGQKLRVIIGSQKIGEGISIYNVRRVYIIVPHWNMAALDQGVGRTIRIGSHDMLKPNERNVHIFLHAAVKNANGVPSAEVTDNIQLYRMAEAKDHSDRQVYRLLKRSAVDCPLNYKRIVLPTDVEEERECDYIECNYDCDTMEHTSEKNGMYEYDAENVDTSTYNILYASKEIIQIIWEIKYLYKLEFKYDIDTLVRSLAPHSMELILRALDRLISERILIRDRYGMTNYLKEENNVFFLGRDITSTMRYQEAEYSERVYISQYTSLDHLIEQHILKRDTDGMMQLCTESRISEESVKLLNYKTQAIVLEAVTSIQYSASEGKASRSKDRAGRLADMFRKYLRTMSDGVVVHTLYVDEALKSVYNVISKVYKETGLLRKYDADRHVWKTCTRDEELQYNKELKSEDVGKKKTIEGEMDQPLYGRKKGDRLYIVYKSRSSSRAGVVCSKKNAIPAIIELGGVDVSRVYPGESSELLRKHLLRTRVQQSLLVGIDDKDDNYIRNVILLTGYDDARICEIMAKLFVDNDLMVEE